MIPVGPHGDFGSDHPDGKGTFARRKMARPCSGKPLAAFKHLEIITGKITNKREKSKLDELPTAQSTKPIYIRPQSAAPLAASLYATSSSAIGNNGRPMSATLRKQMREFSFGQSREFSEAKMRHGMWRNRSVNV